MKIPLVSFAAFRCRLLSSRFLFTPICFFSLSPSQQIPPDRDARIQRQIWRIGTFNLTRYRVYIINPTTWRFESRIQSQDRYYILISSCSLLLFFVFPFSIPIFYIWDAMERLETSINGRGTDGHGERLKRQLHPRSEIIEIPSVWIIAAPLGLEYRLSGSSYRM